MGAGNTRLRSSFVGREQSGSILVLTALMMVVLMGLVGLVIDVGHRMDMYRQTQNAADAAALAGAHVISIGGSCDQAKAAAALLAQQNGFSSSNSNLQFTCLASSVEYFQAEVSSTFTNFFIPVLGFGHSTVGSKAVAAANPPGGLVQ